MSINWQTAVKASCCENHKTRTGNKIKVKEYDFVNLNPGDRILLRKQWDVHENGIYVVGKEPFYFWKRDPETPLNSDQYLIGVCDTNNLTTYVQTEKCLVGSDKTRWVLEEIFLMNRKIHDDSSNPVRKETPKISKDLLYSDHKDLPIPKIRKPPSKIEDSVPTADLLGLGDF